MEDVLGSGISETIDALNQLLLKTLDPNDEARILALRANFFELLEGSVEASVNQRSSDVEQALSALNSSSKDLANAVNNIAHVSAAIQKAVTAAKAVDKVVKLGLNI